MGKGEQWALRVGLPPAPLQGGSPGDRSSGGPRGSAGPSSTGSLSRPGPGATALRAAPWEPGASQEPRGAERGQTPSEGASMPGTAVPSVFSSPSVLGLGPPRRQGPRVAVPAGGRTGSRWEAAVAATSGPARPQPGSSERTWRSSGRGRATGVSTATGDEGPQTRVLLGPGLGPRAEGEVTEVTEAEGTDRLRLGRWLCPSSGQAPGGAPQDRGPAAGREAQCPPSPPPSQLPGPWPQGRPRSALLTVAAASARDGRGLSVVMGS